MLKPFGKKRLEAMDVISFTLMTMITLIVFIPFYNTVVISFSTSRAYIAHPFALWPKEMTFDNYLIVIKTGTILSSYINTIVITVVGTLLSMAAMVAGAFVFSRRAFPGKKLFFLMLLFTMFFSGGMIPTYLTIKDLNLLNNRWTIILMCGVSVYNVIVLKSGFENIPDALEEAAKIDGANDIQIFVKVMLPLMKAQIATFTLFTAVSYWNEWFWPMLVINSSGKMTLMSYLRAIVMEAASVTTADSAVDQDMENFTMGVRMATIMLTMLPIMCVYPFLQKHFAKGIMLGSVKM